MRNFSAEKVLERLKGVLNASSDSALARALDTTPQTISSWKARDSVPYAKCVSLAEEEGLSLDWLLTGQGTMYRDKTSTGVDLTPEQQALLTLFNDLAASDQREILHDAEKKKRLSELEQQVAELMTGAKK